ncbi:hypothetical protein DERP_002079, partial [Dermatophagoides pteronyssinus]
CSIIKYIEDVNNNDNDQDIGAGHNEINIYLVGYIRSEYSYIPINLIRPLFINLNYKSNDQFFLVDKNSPMIMFNG